jgi:hypothetical protein
LLVVFVQKNMSQDMDFSFVTDLKIYIEKRKHTWNLDYINEKNHGLDLTKLNTA